MDDITEKVEVIHSSASASIDTTPEKASTQKEPIASVAVKDEGNAVAPTSTTPPMTFKRLMALLSLTGLIITAAVPSFLITAALCTPSVGS